MKKKVLISLTALLAIVGFAFAAVKYEATSGDLLHQGVAKWYNAGLTGYKTNASGITLEDYETIKAATADWDVCYKANCVILLNRPVAEGGYGKNVTEASVQAQIDKWNTKVDGLKAVADATDACTPVVDDIVAMAKAYGSNGAKIASLDEEEAVQALEARWNAIAGNEDATFAGVLEGILTAKNLTAAKVNKYFAAWNKRLATLHEIDGTFYGVYGESTKNEALIKAWLHNIPENIVTLMGYSREKNNGTDVQDTIAEWISLLPSVDLTKEDGYVQKDIDNMAEKGGEAWNLIAVDMFKEACGTLLNNWDFTTNSGTLFERTVPRLKAVLTAYEALEKKDALKNGKTPDNYMPNLGKELKVQYNIVLSDEAYSKLRNSESALEHLILRPWYKDENQKASSDMQSLLDYMEAWNALLPKYADEPTVKTAIKAQGLREHFLQEGKWMLEARDYLAQDGKKPNQQNVNKYFLDGDINKGPFTYEDCKVLCQIDEEIEAKEEGVKKYIDEVYTKYMKGQLAEANDSYYKAYANNIEGVDVENNKIDDLVYAFDLMIRPLKGTECMLPKIQKAIDMYLSIREYLEVLNGILYDEDTKTLTYDDLYLVKFAENNWRCKHMTKEVELEVLDDIAAKLSVKLESEYSHLQDLKKQAQIDQIGSDLAQAYIDMYDDMIKRTTYQNAVAVTSADKAKLADAIWDGERFAGGSATDAYKAARAAYGLTGWPIAYYWVPNNYDGGNIKKVATGAHTEEGGDIEANAKKKIKGYMYGSEDAFCQGAMDPHANNDVKNGRGEKNEEGYNYGTFGAKLEAAKWMAKWENVEKVMMTLPDGTQVDWKILDVETPVTRLDAYWLRKAKAEYETLKAKMPEAVEYIDYKKYLGTYKDIIPVEVDKVTYYSHCFDAPEVHYINNVWDWNSPISLTAVENRLDEIREKEIKQNGVGTNAYVVLSASENGTLSRDNFELYETKGLKLPANFVIASKSIDRTPGEATTQWVADTFKIEMNAPYKIVEPIAANALTVSRAAAKVGERSCLYLPIRVVGENFDNLEADNEIYAIGGAYVDDVTKTVAFGLSDKGVREGDRYLASFKPYIAVPKTEVKNLEFADVTIETTDHQYPLVSEVMFRTVFEFSSSTDATMVNVGEYYLNKNELKKRAAKVEGKPNPLAMPAGMMKLVVTDITYSDYAIGFEGDDLGEATGIQDVNAAASQNDAIFNISGQKVNTMNRPGIYVVNGKKVSVK